MTKTNSKTATSESHRNRVLLHNRRNNEDGERGPYLVLSRGAAERFSRAICTDFFVSMNGRSSSVDALGNFICLFLKLMMVSRYGLN